MRLGLVPARESKEKKRRVGEAEGRERKEKERWALAINVLSSTSSLIESNQQEKHALFGER